MRFNPNSKGRSKWLLIIGVPIVALAIIGKMSTTNPPTNTAQTAPNETLELRTRIYSQSNEEVMQIAQKVAREQKTWLKSWRMVKVDTEKNLLEIEVPVLVFTDDLTIFIDESAGQTRVNVQSKSRVGRGDFGENRRHIAQFLRALDKALV